ncbi:MAG: hypothetical protein K0V04_37880 [Deltaproteobacteria bacterium]|nr:hypothetical protein [Deltaproteobacteria bacterium]
MKHNRTVLELLRGRTDTVVTADWQRLVERRDRVVALLRASRRPGQRAPIRYRSRYAASLWALSASDGPGRQSEPEPPVRRLSLVKSA